MASYRAKLPVVSSGGAVIKSVQRYTTIMTGSNTSKTVNLSVAVDTSKSYVKSLRVYSDSSTVSYGSGALSITAELNANSVVLTRTNYNTTSDLLTISFEVVTYQSGVSVQRGVLSTTGGKNPVAAISAIDSSRSFCESTFRGGAGELPYPAYIEMLGNTSIIFSRGYTAQIEIAWQVITYV